MRRTSRRKRKRHDAAPAVPRPKRSLFSRLTAHLREGAATLALVVREPRRAPALLRQSLVGLWRARGGGLYGLGFVVTFVILEVETFEQQLVTSTSLLAFVYEQLLEYVLRFAVLSFVNTLLALGWPVLLLDKLGGWGIVVLAVGFLSYERVLKPLVERVVPELRAAPAQSAAVSPADPAPAPPGAVALQLPAPQAEASPPPRTGGG